MAMAWVDSSPFERRSIQSGMRVRAADGTVLGHVARIGRERVYVRKRFSRRWRAVPLTRVERIHGGEVFVAGPPAEATEPVTDELLASDLRTFTYPLAAASGEGHAAP
jgi:hypothetical protein